MEDFGNSRKVCEDVTRYRIVADCRFEINQLPVAL